MRARGARWIVAGLMVLAGAGAAGLAAGEPPVARLRVNTFPGFSYLALYVAQARGFFARRGLQVEVHFTQTSQEQREGLARGDFQIAHGGADNAVAVVELARADAVIVMGGDSGMNSLFAQPDIRTPADLRGRIVIVDAPNTSYALLLYKMLDLSGVHRAEYTVKAVGATTLRLDAMRQDTRYAATMLNPPFSVLGEQAGLRDLGPATGVLGAYQGPSVYVMRPWAQANREVLVRYLQACVEALRWALDPANRAEVVGLMADRLKLSPEVAARAFDITANPAGGLARDGRFDLEGFANTLKLRAEIEGRPGAIPPPADKYVDLSYYERALAGLERH